MAEWICVGGTGEGFVRVLARGGQGVTLGQEGVRPVRVGSLPLAGSRAVDRGEVVYV